MSLSTDAILAGVALVLFANWLETAGYGGWPFALSGLGLVAVAFLGSLGSTLVASNGAPAPDDGP
ncbi:MAG: hypothetical protein V5A31_12545 [Haloferacaceae archaeon]|jgi:hypothetical protein